MRDVQFDGLLEIAGLPTTDVVEIDDLDTLIDKLSIVADELDRRTKTDSPLPDPAPDSGRARSDCDSP
jgi:hypothetical protein